MPRTKYFFYIMFLLIGLTGSTIISKAGYHQYLAPAIPFVAIIGATGLYSLIDKKKSFYLLLLFAIIPSMVVFLRGAILTSNAKQVAKINYILSITDEYDHMLYGGTGCNPFRKTVDFFWFTVQSEPPVIIQTIKEKNPKVIYNVALHPSIKAILRNTYQPDPVYPDLLIRKENNG